MSKNVFKLFLVSILLLSSCAPVRVEMPSYGGKTFRQVLSGMQDVSAVKTRFSIVFVNDGRERRGDAALDLAQNGDMSLRIYSLGFLATELSSKDGVVRSSPPIDPDKYFILTEGLKDCFFWWSMRDRSLTDEDGRYILADARRTVLVDKKTFLPSRQEILFDNGREVDIYYDRPARDGDSWYQSRIRIEYGGYSATLLVSHMEFEHH
jgi:hypothetical protein